MKHSNGQGSISYEKERDTYRAAITDPNGTRLRKRFPTKREAEEWLTLTRASFLNSTYVPDSGISVGDWALEYLKLYAKNHIKETTLRNYKHDAQRLDPIAKTKLEDLTAIELQKFFNNTFADTPASGRMTYDFLSLILDKAVSLELLRKNPLANVTPPEHKRKDIEIFTKEEIQTILDVAQHSRYRRYCTLIKLAACTGARMGELFALKHSNVFPNHIKIEKTVSVVEGHTVESEPKTKSSKRIISISKDMYQELSALDHNCEYVFHSAHNTPLKQTNFAIAWERLLEKAGIPHRTFHALRHTHATLLLANNIPLIEVSKRLGHSRPSVTLNIYGHYMPHYDETLPDKIDQIYAVAPKIAPKDSETAENIVKS